MQSSTDSNLNNYNADVKLKTTVKKDTSMKPKTPLDIIKGRCNQKRSKYYLTTGSSVETDKSLPRLKTYLNTQKFYGFNALEKIQRRDDFRKRLKKNYAEKDTYRSSLNRNMRERLSVEEPIDDIRTVTEIDPFFYTIVEGRPFRDKSGVKRYVDEMKTSAVFNLITGYLKDDVLKYNENLVEEYHIYCDVCKRHNAFVDAFEKYLNVSYEKAMDKLKQYNEGKNTLYNKNQECKRLNAELGKVIRKIYNQEEKLRLAKTYQDFLDYISPHSWWRDNDLKLDHVKIETALDRFQAHQQPVEAEDEETTLKLLIERFMFKFRNDQHPKVYFTAPWQITKVLRNIEVQNMTHWSNSEQLTVNVQKAVDALDCLTRRINAEFITTTSVISALAQSIADEERSAAASRSEIERLLSTAYLEATFSEDVLKLNVCTRRMYDRLIFSEAAFETVEMMHALECEYEANMARLDVMNPDIVLAVKRECYEDDVMLMDRAKMAARKLRNLESLLSHMKRALMKNS